MNTAFYTARSGLLAQTSALSVHANNMANIQTNGYKYLRPSFADLLYTVPREQQEDWQDGHGTRIAKTDLMFSKGSFYMTDSELDFALPNEGFFAVNNQYGEVSYTRDGAFAVSPLEDGNWYLTSGTNGDLVLDYEGNPIQLVKDEDGSFDFTELTNRIGVYQFDNPYGLEADGDNRYAATERSGEAAANPALEKVMGALERSNLEITDEMVRLIQTQRSYQLSAKMVQTADELARIANNLR